MVKSGEPSPLVAAQPEARTQKVILVGLMGAGKSCIGRRLASKLGLPFIDSDTEIEAAAGCSVPEYFEKHGEAAFRDGERAVLRRLLTEPRAVIVATGGGAFMNRKTRQVIRQNGVSVWLRADLDLLVRRTSRRDHRPLLKTGNPREILARLIDERYPVYAKADLVVDSVDGPPDITVTKVLTTLKNYGVEFERV
jgi:shikimate kinase|tara:strand:- start:171 stop:755 length:585 start_codon:yes stop_codon:yes gene_type:complete